jgi:hypothetical protein
MKNVSYKINEKTGKLVIEIDITKEFGLSKSGKTIIIGSTCGNINLGNGVTLGLNAYKPAK